MENIKREIVLSWNVPRGEYEYRLNIYIDGKLNVSTILDGLAAANGNAHHYNLDVPEIPEV